MGQSVVRAEGIAPSRSEDATFTAWGAHYTTQRAHLCCSANSAGRENRTPSTSLATTCAATTPYPRTTSVPPRRFERLTFRLRSDCTTSCATRAQHAGSGSNAPASVLETNTLPRGRRISDRSPARVHEPPRVEQKRRGPGRLSSRRPSSRTPSGG